MEVPFFPYSELFLEDKDRYLGVIEKTLSRGAFIMQDELALFESKLANYLGCAHAFGVADGTAALEMSLICAGLQPGDEVIISSHTFIATASAVKSLGGIPVLADCGADSQICPKSVERCITGKTRILMPTQLNGRTCDMDALLDVAGRHDLRIVEDSCQGLGAKYKNKFAGLFGVAGSFSFYPAKTLGCFGDGGAVVTNDRQTAEKVAQLRDHGRRAADGKVTMFGRNGRLDNVQAAVLSLKIDKHDEYIEKRRANAQLYDAMLKDIPELSLPVAPDSDPIRFDTFQNYELLAERRDELREFLAANGIGTIKQWGGWMLHQFEDLKFKADADFAEKMSRSFFLLPMNHMLKFEQVEYVCETIKKFYAKG